MELISEILKLSNDMELPPCEALRRIRFLAEHALAQPTPSGPRWSSEPPQTTGRYWHWSGVSGEEPTLQVLDRDFVGIGSYWQPLLPPSTT